MAPLEKLELVILDKNSCLIKNYLAEIKIVLGFFIMEKHNYCIKKLRVHIITCLLSSESVISFMHNFSSGINWILKKFRKTLH